MRIEIADDVAYLHVIDTDDPAMAGQWFARKAEMLMSANSRFGDCRMRIWPSNEAETKTIGRWDNRLTQDNLLELARHLLAVSETLGKLEAS